MIYHFTAHQSEFVCQSISQVFIILEIYNLGKCMCVSVTCFLSTSFFSLYHSTMVRWGTLNLKTDGVWFILPFFFLQLNICLWKNNKRCFLSFCHLQLRSQVYIKVVYICSRIWLLAVGSRDLSQAEKKITVAKAEQIQLFSLKMTIFDHYWVKIMVFCYQNCSDLL